MNLYSVHNLTRCILNDQNTTRFKCLLVFVRVEAVSLVVKSIDFVIKTIKTCFCANIKNVKYGSSHIKVPRKFFL